MQKSGTSALEGSSALPVIFFFFSCMGFLTFVHVRSPKQNIQKLCFMLHLLTDFYSIGAIVSIHSTYDGKRSLKQLYAS